MGCHFRGNCYRQYGVFVQGLARSLFKNLKIEQTGKYTAGLRSKNVHLSPCYTFGERGYGKGVFEMQHASNAEKVISMYPALPTRMMHWCGVCRCTIYICIYSGT